MKLVRCEGYRAELSPWACVANQLGRSEEGWYPCRDCAVGVGIEIKRRPRRRRRYDPKLMTRAVARALGLL